MKNNLLFTILSSMVLLIASLFLNGFSPVGIILGVLYAQIIEWFVHGWIQHHPFKLFRGFRRAHNFHHKHPDVPRAVQPIQYFFIGSVPLLAPFYLVNGFWAGYFFAYIMVNIIHFDLHSTSRVLPPRIWSTAYFRKIESNHEDHHNGTGHHSRYSVTNPYMDVVFDFLMVTRLNNFIAKKLKI